MAMKRKPGSTTAALAKAARAAAPRRRYLLRLYVAGINPRSAAAIHAITALCKQHLRGRYDLKVVDIYQQPALAKGEQIVAAPTLIKKLPEPVRRFIGNLADTERILVGLQLKSIPKSK